MGWNCEFSSSKHLFIIASFLSINVHHAIRKFLLQIERIGWAQKPRPPQKHQGDHEGYSQSCHREGGGEKTTLQKSQHFVIITFAYFLLWKSRFLFFYNTVCVKNFNFHMISSSGIYRIMCIKRFCITHIFCNNFVSSLNNLTKIHLVP